MDSEEGHARSADELAPANKQRFRDFGSTDLMVRQCFTDADGRERVFHEEGSLHEMGHYFYALENAIRLVIEGDKPPCYRHRRGWALSEEARTLWHAFRNVHKAPKELCEGRRLSPRLKVGLHCANRWEVLLRPYRDKEGELDVSFEAARNMISKAVNFIRRVCKSKKFRDIESNCSRNAWDNYLSCANYLLDLLRCHARLLILRIDLYFVGDAKVFSETPEARKAYDKFLRSLSAGSIVPGVLGYAGKREDGLERRIHYHVLVVLDGNEHRQDFSLTEKIGRYWVSDCVGSSRLGDFFNCSRRKLEYRYNCIGLMHYTDETPLRGLREALLYICKEAAHVLVRDDGGRNLRKGKSPAPPSEESRVGAPRKHGSDLWLARRILLAKPEKKSRRRR